MTVFEVNADNLQTAILSHVEPPHGDPNAPLQLQISALDYSSYTGRLGIGRVRNGRIKTGQMVAVMNGDTLIGQSSTTNVWTVSVGYSAPSEAR